MAAARSLLSGLVLSAVVLTGFAVPADASQTPTATRPPGDAAFTLAPTTLEPASAAPANLGVALSLPLVDDGLAPATGPNGVLSGSRSAAGMVSHKLTDTIRQEWNPTTGNILVTGKLLHLEGADAHPDIDVSWRYNSINDDRPTLSVGTSESALVVGTDNSVTYTASDGGTYKFVPKTGGGWTMPPGLNATIIGLSAWQAGLRFNDTGDMNFYDQIGGGVFRLGYASTHSNNGATVYDYDADGRLSTITTFTGRQVLFEYNDADNTGQASKITDQTLNRVISIDYGSDGRMASVTDATGTTTGLGYTNGKLTLVRDGMGTRNEFSYDANGKAAKIIYASATAGPTGTATWNWAGTSAKAAGAWRTALKPAASPGINPRSFSTASTDTATTTVSIPAPAGRVAGDVLVASFTADRNPTVAVPTGWTAIVDALGINSSNDTGARVFAYYRVVGASDPANYTWTMSKSVKWGGGITAYTGVNTSTPLDSTVATAVDDTYAATSITVGSITTASDGGLLIGGLGFDSSNPTTNPPTGWTERWETTGGQVAEQADRVQDPSLSTTHNLAGVDATTSTLTDTAGRVATYKYNGARQITSITDPLGNVTTDIYDAHDNRLSRLDDLGNLSTATYNPNNTMNNITTPAGATGGTGKQVSYTYPAPTAGEHWLEYQPVSSTDSEGQVTTYTYDTVLGWPYQTVTPGGAAGAGTKVNRYQGDAAGTTCGAGRGQLCKTIDGNGNTTSITYDAARNPATITPPAPLGATTRTFDAAGRVATSTDGKNQIAIYSYDGNDRMLQTRFGATCVPATCMTYTYDANGNLKTIVDGSGTTTHSYDVQNRPTSKTIGGVSTSLTYDPASNVTSFTDPTGTVGYRYDNADRLTALAEPGGSCPATPAFPNSTKCTGFTYDDNNRRTGTMYPNGVKNTTVYDNSGRITSITATNTAAAVLAKRAYTHTTWGTAPVRDGALRKTMTTETGEVTTYGYDAVRRLTSAVTGAVTESWTYDLNGNRLTDAKSGTATVHSAYNAADQLCWYASTSGNCSAPPAGATNYAYDANGNFTDGGSAANLTYNEFDQFTSGTNGTTVTNYTYAGTRNDERLTAGSTSFLNGSLGITQLTRTGGATSFIRDPDGNLISMRDSSGASYYYTTDALGSVILLTDSAQAKAATYGYDSWGQATSTTGTKAATNPWTYAGGYNDTTSNRIKFGARYYHPARGRFTQPDPSGQEANRYLYAGANPCNNTDVTGLSHADCGFAAFAVAGAGLGFILGAGAILATIATGGILLAPTFFFASSFLGIIITGVNANRTCN
ncbi:RHS repeat domain-containing protein [Pseudarthrobacter sp. SSS035]|uniref:RHS repeat domain-containing protein n=1 Tax=Pseudarthrobacter sp. SSS035 TaxID=2931399 RepID=UPI00200DF67A|nr:RHS repeat-associated core domain-containing protein [Pseudarthrobacter sp. SSS035]